MFHVSLLRPFVDGGVLSSTVFPFFFARGCAVARPFKLADRRRVYRHGAAVDEGLLLWDDDEGRRPYVGAYGSYTTSFSNITP